MEKHQNSLSDEELIQQAAHGDQDSFGDLYERYLEDIYRYVYYRVQDVTDAEDLTETVFLRAWESLHKGKKPLKVDNFRAWIYRIAHNLVIDHHRKKRPVSLDPDVSSNLLESSSPDAEDALQQKLDEEDLIVALNSLDDTLQHVVILRFLNDLSHAEAAEVLGVKEGHMRVLQHRALKQLRKYLREDKDEYS